MDNTRRDLLGAAVGAAALTTPLATEQPEKKIHFRGPRPEGIPLFPSAVTFGNQVFVSGHGVNTVAGAKEQTAKTLDQIEEVLKGVGSSLAKVLKCNVYLADIRDYAAMNEAYLGRFGADPPARTTLAVANIPLKGCLVEIEMVAYI